MHPKSLKTILFACIALVLSAGHSVCASIALPSQTDFIATHDAHNSPDHQGHGDTPSHQSDHDSSSHTAPCGPDSSDCQHCVAAQYYKSAAKTELAGATSFPTFEKAFFIPVAILRPAVTKPGYSLYARRWRGPPGETPVSLKIRLRT